MFHNIYIAKSESGIYRYSEGTPINPKTLDEPVSKYYCTQIVAVQLQELLACKSFTTEQSLLQILAQNAQQ